MRKRGEETKENKIRKERRKKEEADADKKVIIKTLGSGQYFGEIAAMTGYKHAATVRVRGDPKIPSTEQCLIVAAMPNQVFKRLEEEVPSCYLTFR